MTASTVRWHVSLPQGDFDGLLLPADDNNPVTIDDPVQVRELVRLALHEPDDSTKHADVDRWRDVRLGTSSGEQLILRFTQADPPVISRLSTGPAAPAPMRALSGT